MSHAAYRKINDGKLKKVVKPKEGKIYDRRMA